MSSVTTTRAICSWARPAAPFWAGTSSSSTIEGNRREVDVDDKRLRDKVADNKAKYEITESESLVFGQNFGVTPDLKEAPDGSLYVVSAGGAQTPTGVVYRDSPQVGRIRWMHRPPRLIWCGG